jgi:hypothetical protein
VTTVAELFPLEFVGFLGIKIAQYCFLFNNSRKYNKTLKKLGKHLKMNLMGINVRRKFQI